MRIWLLIFGLLATLLTGCSLYDERDECCGVTFHFRYLETGQDVFYDHIRSMRHFLFDGDRMFLREITDTDGNRTDEDLFAEDIKNGFYTMVSVANTTEAHTAITSLQSGVHRLEDFNLYLMNGETRTRANGYYDNADELLYNARRFEVTETERDFYFMDFSNVHCHLHVHLYWHKLTDYRGNFTMKLYGVPADFPLSPDSMMRVKTPTDDESLIPSKGNSVQLVPKKMMGTVDHQIEVMPYNFKLMGEFITHRRTNEQIPVLQVFNGKKEVTRRIILSEVLKAWNIKPDSDPLQDYWLDIEVYPDGSSHVSRYVTGKVNDWIDGGTVTPNE